MLDLDCLMCRDQAGGGVRCWGSKYADVSGIMARDSVAVQASEMLLRFWEAYSSVVPSDQHEAVGKESGKTNHVERWNNTLRQRLGQFVRKTLSFSKSWELHVARLRLFVHRYNLEIAENILN
jgi:hypothetical protein